MATFVPEGRIHWTRNPFDEPAEFVFVYYGANSLEASGLVDLTAEVPITNDPVSGTRRLQLDIDQAQVDAATKKVEDAE
jgi:oxalate decarboxylase/phosphoglucose isomerase-like protein (cupin superfamily)